MAYSLSQRTGGVVAQQLDHLIERDVLVMGALLGFGRGGEDRLGQPVALAQALRQAEPTQLPGGLVRLPAAPGDVAADDDLDGQDVDLPAEHHPAAQGLDGDLVVVA